MPCLDDRQQRLERVRALAVGLDCDAFEDGRVKDLEDLAAGPGPELLDYGVLVGSLSKCVGHPVPKPLVELADWGGVPVQVR